MTMHRSNSNPSDAGPQSPGDVPTCFDSAFNCGDVEAVLALFDEPATMRMTNHQVIEADRASLRIAFTQLLSLRPQIQNTVRSVLCCDDVALVLMDWTITMQNPAGQEQIDRGTATQVMKRRANGSWRLKISNPLGVA